MDNIEIFNLAAGEILGRCYSTFPAPIILDYREVVGSLRHAVGEPHDPENIHFNDPHYKALEHSLSWLIRADYIWVEHVQGNLLGNSIRLSPLGLHVLNAVPESLQVRETFGERLSKGAAQLGKEAISTTVTAVLGLAIQRVMGV
jgi:hypothetical protein